MNWDFYRFRNLAILVGITYLASFLYFERWEVAIIHGGDGWGYYGYLPAAFIYGDLDNIDESYMARFAYASGPAEFPAPGGELPVAENGHRVIKYTCGIAILQAPFFALAHAYASWSDTYAADGFSPPYIILVMLGSWCYILLGGWLLFRLLSHFVDRQAAFWSLLVIALGTHFFNFAVYRADMSHTYLASLYAILMYASWQFYDKPAYRWAVLIGVSAGFITLIRPVEILCLAIPLTYGLVSREALRSRWQTWVEQWPKLLAAAIVFVLSGIPQPLYWKNATGHWTFDSYPGESFDFAHAKIAGGLFSYQNGWFVYAPIMIFAVLGIFFLLKKRNWLWPIVLILPLHIYIAYSWWCWYYINGLGSRPMVEMVSLLSVPLAYWLVFMRKRNWTKYSFRLLLIGVIVLQIFQNWQHSKGILWTEFGNKAYYWTVFGQTEMSYEALVAFDSKEMQADLSKLTKQKILLDTEIEATDSTRIDVTQDIVHSGQYSGVLRPERRYFELYNAPIRQDDLQTGQWIVVRVWCRKERKEMPFYTAPALIVSADREGKPFKFRETRIDTKLRNTTYSLWGGQAGHWDEVRFTYRMPKDLRPDDVLKVYLRASNEPVYFDEMQVEVWE